MKLLTWNINGLRATTYGGNFQDDDNPNTESANTKSLKHILTTLDADVVCLQEVKTPRDQLEEPLALVDGYVSFFSFPKKRSAYSGVATFCRNSCVPTKTEEGLTDIFLGSSQAKNTDWAGNDDSEFSKEELKELDGEGRALITHHETSEGETLSIINVYCPFGGDEGERVDFKMKFYRLMKKKAMNLLGSGCRVVIVGDINTSHHLIDHCEGDTRDPKEFYENPGRTFLTDFIHPCPDSCDIDHDAIVGKVLANEGDAPVFADAFRCKNPDLKNAFTCWNTAIGARATNYGTRLDYVFPDIALKSRRLRDCRILPNVKGSDHCPVVAEFDLTVASGPVWPKTATKFWPEFAGGSQKTLGCFFSKASEKDDRFKRSSEEADAGGNAAKRAKPTPKTMLDFLQKSASKPRSEASEIPSGDKKEKSISEKQISEENPSVNSENNANAKSSETWKRLLKGPAKAPLCKGHKEPCVLNTVKKAGPNLGKKFYVCPRPQGHASNKEARCNHFEWVRKS